MITGGTGSFGNAVLEKFINSDFLEIRVFSRDEKKQDDMRRKYLSDKVKFFLGDVRDRDSILPAIAGSDYVFHAAALKQVPSCEFFPLEAVKTNVVGFSNLIWAGRQVGVKKIVLLSTDKAVYPINAMGMSKAMAEKVMVAESRNYLNDNLLLCATRYGNVMASRGSVIPLFVNQIKNGLPLTITDPNMTRFMMTLEEAVDLVLYAFSNGKKGEIYVQKSPASTIGDIATALLEIYNAKNEVKIIGVRHGEKHYETLVNREEMMKALSYDKYYCIPMDKRNLDYELYFTDGSMQLSSQEEYTSHNTYRLDIENTKSLLLKIKEIREDIAK